MKRLLQLLFITTASIVYGQNVYITEIHYDNAGTDVGEFVEVFITDPQPTDLSDYVLTLYNGSNGTSYASELFSNADVVNPNQTNGFGTGTYYVFNIVLQNGGPDGIATSNSSGVFEFLSYEGSFNASGGPADGLSSTNIGSTESGSTPIGTSIQNNGAGTWTSGLPETPGDNNNNDILPVEFSRFTAKNNGKNIELLWSTASELNNDRFEILRSTDGKSFEMIGSVAGQGTSLKNNNYSFVDEQPLAGMNYYKLKQVDFDGRYDFSDVVVVENEKLSNIRINPTTTSDYFTISTESKSSVSIVNTSGQIVAQQANDEGIFTFDMQHLPKGLYFVTVESRGIIETKKVVKN